ncbi:MAG: IS5/IS1182 family transposase [Oceanospirillum sp.]|nr:IS5/IS1182 family transposase [Oceanospirillum sp.]
MPRLILTDEYWSKLTTIFKQIRIYNKPDLRMMVEGMFYRIRVGCAWRDLPAVFGEWNSVYKKFNAWSVQGKWTRIFEAVVHDPDLEWVFIDGSYVKAHQHSSGAAKGLSSAIGKSRAGLTSKIHMAVDAYGLPICFRLTGGNTHDSRAAYDLINNLPFGIEAIVGDKGYDSSKIREQILSIGAKCVIPRRKGSLTGNDDLDRGLYRCRHLVENVFARLKHFRAVATRYDKLERNYYSVLSMACCFLWFPM